ncbi:glutathione S-transferase family protein [Phaeobacter gallaeciensis]|uniref:glutathione S-transferase family protein n=1 Tax=Phaeobacter gallaeciensis TaxID=60890 RepID=UPI00237F4D35|nr:glutathione S-transferase [Phaeobacter gallaeciensis]MDE4097554.1 glutathione S-transferase [Phaeobacter gallaeciensis]MDE4106608.1 glutathione S-transferase [Phaeobacter gallaeciensis]MDE4110818.1 glutathione S-transferase [Phaeobacter gallaeciensis]MDE4115533.1 glutathione S-transferase [Phaeobacter gallaeciensis]MDE4120003.1 glutathione S-transferase [Phaeobacter gallaeciensis]
MTQPIRIHGFPLSGHSHRVELFANLAGIEHEMITVDLAAGAHKAEPFLSLNPAGQVPVIEDGDTVITDSNAILVYLARKYAPAYLPSDPVLEAEVQKFLTLAAGEIAFGPAAARLINVFNAPFDAEFCAATAATAFGKIEAHMEGREFLVGTEPTIADIAIYSYSAHAPEGGISLEAYPNLRRLLANVEGLKGFKAMPVTKVGLAA